MSSAWFFVGNPPSPVAGQFYIVFFQTLGTPEAFTLDFPALYQSVAGAGIQCDIAAAYAAGAITLPYTFHMVSTLAHPYTGNTFVNQFTRESVPNPISHVFGGGIGAGQTIVTITVAAGTGLISLVYSS